MIFLRQRPKRTDDEFKVFVARDEAEDADHFVALRQFRQGREMRASAYGLGLFDLPRIQEGQWVVKHMLDAFLLQQSTALAACMHNGRNRLSVLFVTQ